MSITILDAARHRGVKEEADGSISLGEFDRVGLPFFAGCQCCEAQLAPYNAFPSTTGYIRCRDCVGDQGFETVEAFEAFESDDGEGELSIEDRIHLDVTGHLPEDF